MTEITEELRDALSTVANLGQAYDMGQADRHALSKIIDALPEELTNPLPEDPGYYLSGDKIFMLRHTEDWYEFGDLGNALKPEYVRTQMPLRLLEVKQDTPEDERITAWNRIADHPLFEGDYDSEGTLIDAMLAHLDRLGEEKYPERVVRESKRAEFIKVGDKIQGDVVTEIGRAAGYVVILRFAAGPDLAVRRDHFIEGWEAGE